MKFIKEQLKDSLLKYDQLSEQVKELLKNVKIDIKIKLWDILHKPQVDF